MYKNLRSLLMIAAAGVVAGLVIATVMSKLHSGHVHDVASVVAPSSAVASEVAAQKYTCGMHPMIITDEPGLCPICNMDLTPLKADGSTDSDMTTGERKI